MHPVNTYQNSTNPSTVVKSIFPRRFTAPLVASFVNRRSYIASQFRIFFLSSSITRLSLCLSFLAISRSIFSPLSSSVLPPPPLSPPSLLSLSNFLSFSPLLSFQNLLSFSSIFFSISTLSSLSFLSVNDRKLLIPDFS